MKHEGNINKTEWKNSDPLIKTVQNLTLQTLCNFKLLLDFVSA